MTHELKTLEKRHNLRPGEAAKLLGLDYKRYNEFKNGSQDLKPYHLASIWAYTNFVPTDRVKEILEEMKGESCTK